MLIRVAKDLDVLDLIRLGKAYYENEAHNWQGMTINYPHLSNHMRNAVGDTEQLLMVAEEDGKIVGGIWMCVNDHVWTTDLIARDLFLFVLPEHRSFKLARSLILHMEMWAATKNVKKILVGAMSGINDNRAAIAVYKRMGYAHQGTSLCKTL